MSNQKIIYLLVKIFLKLIVVNIGGCDPNFMHEKNEFDLVVA